MLQDTAPVLATWLGRGFTFGRLLGLHLTASANLVYIINEVMSVRAVFCHAQAVLCTASVVIDSNHYHKHRERATRYPSRGWYMPGGSEQPARVWERSGNKLLPLGLSKSRNRTGFPEAIATNGAAAIDNNVNNSRHRTAFPGAIATAL